ncbi:Hypothetical predicted protein, partial [Pelobates cultripes]
MDRVRNTPSTTTPSWPKNAHVPTSSNHIWITQIRLSHLPPTKVLAHKATTYNDFCT